MMAELCQSPGCIWNASCMGSRYSGSMFKGKIDFWNCREGVMSELLYTDNLVLMSEMMEGLGNKFL